MILSLDDTIKQIGQYDDSYATAVKLDGLAAALAKGGSPHYAELIHAARNLRGMQDLLRSARHHLATKALDSA